MNPIADLTERVESTVRRDASQLIQTHYDELRRLAGFLVNRYRPSETLQATALLHEAYLRVCRRNKPDWGDSRHFYAVVSQAMRHILVDHARYSKVRKSRANQEVEQELDDLVAAYESRCGDLLELDEALAVLQLRDARLARSVEFRFFGGLRTTEIARLEGVSRRTTERDLASAKLILASLLQEKDKRVSV